MRCLAAVPVLLVCMLASAHAQHGGGAHAGGGHASMGGGFRGGPGFGPGHASVGGPARMAFPGRGFSTMPGRAFGGSFSARGVRGNPYASPYRVGRPGYPARMPFRGGTVPGAPYSGFGHGGYRSASFGRLPYRRYGTGLRFFNGLTAYPAFVDFGFLNPYWNFADLYGSEQGWDEGQGWGDARGGNEAQVAASGPGSPEAPANPYAPAEGAYANPAAGAFAGQPAPAGGQDDVPMVYAPYVYGQPGPSQPQVSVITLPPPQREEDAVTLFYRDGRPPEQIRNYALTRDALFITGPRLREIPLADLDLALTERVNKAAGVDFRLPGKAPSPVSATPPQAPAQQ